MINGLKIVELKKFHDSRGSLFEMHRNEWHSQTTPIQWNSVFSKSNVIRGFHVHPKHTDFLVCVSGKFTVRMRDLRTSSPTYLAFKKVTLDSDNPRLLTIPPGVGHGFEFLENTLVCYGLNSYWSLAEELDCHYNSPELGIEWAVKNPLLSERDDNSGSFITLLKELEIYQNAFKDQIVSLENQLINTND